MTCMKKRPLGDDGVGMAWILPIGRASAKPPTPVGRIKDTRAAPMPIGKVPRNPYGLVRVPAAKASARHALACAKPKSLAAAKPEPKAEAFGLNARRDRLNARDRRRLLRLSARVNERAALRHAKPKAAVMKMKAVMQKEAMEAMKVMRAMKAMKAMEKTDAMKAMKAMPCHCRLMMQPDAGD